MAEATQAAPQPVPELVLTPELGIAYASILLMALIPIVWGSHLSVNRKKPTESMKAKDAYMYPFIAGGFLVGLYVLFKFLNKDYINILLNAYFLLFGTLSVVATLRGPVTAVWNAVSGAKLKTYKIKIPLLMDEADEFTLLDLVSLVLTIALIAWYVMTKHWISNNLFGISFSVQGISLVPVPSFQIAAILLGGLFFYDVFFVFGTDVMVTVAKSFDAPIKLLFPKDIFASTYSYSMLGLGDIVLPGVLLALMLRYDSFRAGGKKDGFKKSYFIATFIGYVIGLALTIYIMHTFKAAQPALLYLVPSCLGAVVINAVIQGDIKGLFAYNEESDDKEDNEEKKTK